MKRRYAGFKNESMTGFGHLFSYPPFCVAEGKAIQHTLQSRLQIPCSKMQRHHGKKLGALGVLFYLEHNVAFCIPFL